jgi:hypothetical protein
MVRWSRRSDVTWSGEVKEECKRPEGGDVPALGVGRIIE